MDYGTRIADATNTKNASYGTYNQYAGQADQAYDKYNQQLDSSRGYGDIYDAARQKYMNTDEINAAKGTYQNSRDAVNQINTTINKLPESIRQQYGGTGLTEAQRARAMGDQQAQLANTFNNANTSYQNNLADYQDLANRGMQETQNVAGGDYQRQQDMINQYQSRWGALLGQRNTSYGQYQQDLAALAGVNSERDKAEQIRQQLELERWKEQQANARAQKELNLRSYFASLAQQQATPTAPQEYVPQSVSVPSQRIETGNPRVVDDGGWGGLVKQGWQNVKDYGPLALFGGGSLWH